MRAEPYRSVAVRLRNGHLSRQLSIIGKPKDMDLSRVLDLDDRADRRCRRARAGHQRARRPDPEPAARRRRGGGHPGGAARHPAGPGGRRDQELFRPHRLHGHRCARPGDVRAAADRRPHRLRHADNRTSCSPRSSPRPSIGSIALQRHALTRFRETIAQNINYSVTIYVTLAVIIAFGVVYNSARIQLSEHARELASLQGAGLHARARSRACCSPSSPCSRWLRSPWLGDRLRLRLAADQGVLQRPLSRALRHRAAQPMPRRALVVLAATAASALIVRRRIDRLDLIAVLKTRD